MSGIPVLMYHDVAPPPPGGLRALTVPPATFARQMRHLADRGWQALSLQAFIDHVTGAKPAGPKSVFITFDDGLGGLAQHALPLLLDLGLTATVFVVTGAEVTPTDWTGEAAEVARTRLSADDIKNFAQRGIDFGAHSVSHADLTTLEDEALEREIGDSLAWVAECTNTPALAFAYPYGAFDHRVETIVARHGVIGLTTREGLCRAGDGPTALKRTMVQPYNPWLDFRAQLHFGFSPLEALRRSKNRWS